MKWSNSKQRMALLQALGVAKATLPYKSIPGVISSRALEEHLKLYEGYQATLKRIDEAYLELERNEMPKKTIWEHPFRALKSAETYALGGVILHDLFFSNITPKESKSNGLEIEKFIKQHFDSMSEWYACMKATALEARGWVVFAIDKSDEPRILLMDTHDQGTMFNQTPIAIIDCYEHAYWEQFGADKVSYIDAVLSVLNWEEINKRFQSR